MTTTSRAGRNLPAAIGVGVGLGAVIVVALLLWRQGFVVIIALAVIASVVELRTTLRDARGIELTWIPILIGGAATVALAWPYGLLAQVVGVSVTALVCMIWRLFGGQDGYLRDVSASVFVIVYVVFSPRSRRCWSPGQRQ